MHSGVKIAYSPLGSFGNFELLNLKDILTNDIYLSVALHINN